MSMNEISESAELEDVARDPRMQKHLQQIAKSLKLAEPKFRVVDATKKGANYAGIVYRVITEGMRNGKFERINSILKCAPQEETRRELLNTNRIFLREIFFYEKVLPIFADLLSEHHMQLGQFPTLHGVWAENGNEVLILEDLSRKGYVMKSSKTLDYDHVSLAIQHLGRFHAYSFATRAKNPAAFEELKAMEEPIFFRQKRNSTSKSRGELYCDLVEEALKDEDKFYRDRFDAFRKIVYDELVEAVMGANAEPYAVVNHGDCWTNNILFKYDEKTKKPTSLYFIDFQISRYASPAVDLSYMLFCCCTHELREKYFDTLLHQYHDALSDCLAQLDCDVKTLFPYEVLMDHLHKFSTFGAGMAIFVLHIFTDEDMQVTEIKAIEKAEPLMERLRTDLNYKNRIKETFKELIDRNYI
ncbi:uncharacterized protein [Prorops nasuta]|uniref:uncharacterized protein n=1 Tax=Prorops nasuta TaxID=863751 RepID=UPI0034CF0560